MTALAQATHLPDHVRVRLRYRTALPTTESALLMANQLGVQGPFGEEVWILIPKADAYSILEAYEAPFAQLIRAKIVPVGAALTDFRVEPGLEPTVLAYVVT